MSKISVDQLQTLVLVQTISNLILGLMYALILIYTFYRLKIVSIESKKLIIGKIMYLLIIIDCGFRTLLCIFSIISSIPILKDNSQVQQQFNQQQTNNLCIFLIFGDFIQTLIFFCFCWQLVSIWYMGHIQIGNIISNTQCPPLKKKARYLFITIISLLVITFVILLLLFLFWNEIITQLILVRLDIIITSLIPGIMLFVVIFLLIKFSGSPYVSTKYQKRIQNANKIAIFIVLCRCVEIWLLIEVSHSLDDLISFFTVGNSSSDITTVQLIFYVFLVLATLVILDVIPLLTLLNISTIQLFTLDFVQPQESQIRPENLEPLYSSHNSFNEFEMLKDVSFSEDDEQDHVLKEINLDKLFHVDRKITQEKSRGLGIIQQVQIDEKSKYSYAIRTLDIQNLTNYLLEEIQEDIQKQCKLQGKYIAKNRHIAINDNKIMLISDFCEKGSLSDILKTQIILSRDSKEEGNVQKKYSLEKKSGSVQNLDQQLKIGYDNQGQLIYNSKIQIALKIATIFRYLHHQLQEPVFHGHLSPQNILFDKNMNIKVSDLGLIQLKKFMAIKGNYSNKSQYTAPEHLIEKGNIVINAKNTTDVYSFGLILYEIFLEKEPFKGISLKEIKKIVFNENTRPKIPEDAEIGEEITTLIRCCWQKDIDLRPNFNTILEILQNMCETL